MGKQSEPRVVWGGERIVAGFVDDRPFPLPSPPLGSLPSPIGFCYFTLFFDFSPTSDPSPRLDQQQTMCLVQSATDGTKLPLMRNSAEILVE